MSYRDGWDSVSTSDDAWDYEDETLCTFEFDEDGDEYCTLHESYIADGYTSDDEDAFCLWATQDHDDFV